MNDLDDLIRSSLNEHTPAATPDDALAERVKAAGRRVRRTRTAGVAAVVLVAAGALIWGSGAIPRLAHPEVAATPAATRATSGSSTSGPTELEPPTTSSGSATVRDVSQLGTPIEDVHIKGEMRVSYFASPSGNLKCFIGTSGAGCAANTWAAGVAPARAKVCADNEPLQGPEVWATKAAAWECGGDAHSWPYLGKGSDSGGDGVAWWDSSFGESVPLPGDSSTKMAALRYGRTLVAGDFRCSMATAGVTCTNTATGHGFLASHGTVTLA